MSQVRADPAERLVGVGLSPDLQAAVVDEILGFGGAPEHPLGEREERGRVPVVEGGEGLPVTAGDAGDELLVAARRRHRRGRGRGVSRRRLVSGRGPGARGDQGATSMPPSPTIAHRHGASPTTVGMEWIEPEGLWSSSPARTTRPSSTAKAPSKTRMRSSPRWRWRGMHPARLEADEDRARGRAARAGRERQDAHARERCVHRLRLGQRVEGAPGVVRRDVDEGGEARRHRGEPLQAIHRGEEPRAQAALRRDRRQREGDGRDGGLRVGEPARAVVAGAEVRFDPPRRAPIRAGEERVLQRIIEVSSEHHRLRSFEARLCPWMTTRGKGERFQRTWRDAPDTHR